MNTNSYLKGKVALVTGGARGIGLSYALRLAERGADIAVTDLNLASANQYDAELERLVDGSLTATLEQFGTRVVTGEVDATDAEATRAFADRVASELGSIDIVVCNAGGGVDANGSEPSRLDADRVRATVERNMLSTIFTCTAAVGHMRVGGRGGRIVNIASYAATEATPGARGSDYAVAKAGVAHYTRYLAQELAPEGINVNALAPGFIASGQFRGRFGGPDGSGLSEFAAQIPLGRLGTPEDCANVVEFLVSPLSSYLTGQVIGVDGGLIRHPC